jgi:hypothetical protein
MQYLQFARTVPQQANNRAAASVLRPQPAAHTAQRRSKQTAQCANKCACASVRERVPFAQPTDSACGGRAAEAGGARPLRLQFRALCGTLCATAFSARTEHTAQKKEPKQQTNCTHTGTHSTSTVPPSTAQRCAEQLPAHLLRFGRSVCLYFAALGHIESAQGCLLPLLLMKPPIFVEGGRKLPPGLVCVVRRKAAIARARS